MNIWIFNHYAHGPDLPGGTRHYDFGRELVRRGYQVVIFASSFHHYLHRETRLQSNETWKIEDIDGVKFVWLRTFPYRGNDWRRVVNMVSYMIRSWWLGRKLPLLVSGIQMPDIIIGSSVHLLAVLAAYWVAKHYKVPFVMEVRDLWPQTIVDMGRLSPRHPLVLVLRLLERYLYHRAKCIITLLPGLGEYVRLLGIPIEKVVWIPNGVNLERFNMDWKIKSNNFKKFTVMYLGAHGEANALDTLIAAAKMIQDQGYRNIRFVLIGEGPMKPHLIELAKKLELTNIEFRPPVPKEEVADVLQQADVTVFVLRNLPLYKYGISLNKMFDFLAAGKPIVFGGNSETNPVREAQSGIVVPPEDPKSLAEAIIKLWKTSPREREAMGRRGRMHVEKYYSIPVLVDRLEECLNKSNVFPARR